jgi:hypothetical protein
MQQDQRFSGPVDFVVEMEAVYRSVAGFDGTRRAFLSEGKGRCIPAGRPVLIPRRTTPPIPLPVCANFLAGANLDNEDPTVRRQSMSRFFKCLPGEQRQAFLHKVTEKAS